MISYPMLGKYGRLGNQLFQFASTYAAAKKTCVECRFPLNGHDLRDFNIPDEFFSDSIEYKYVYSDNEQDFSFNHSIHSLQDGTAITGYLQNPNNFNEYKQDILNMISFDKEVSYSAKEIMSKYNNSISIHVRRGDYLNIQDVLPCQSINYYLEGMSAFSNSTPVIFTDDPIWCKDNFNFAIEHHTPILDFVCMTLCSGHVMSNSSFSWWVSYISGMKTIVPIKWFGQKGPKNFQDLYLPYWKKL